MTESKESKPTIEQTEKKAGPFEKVGIWASYRLLQYLESLGQVSEWQITSPSEYPKPPKKRSRPFKMRPFLIDALLATLSAGALSVFAYGWYTTIDTNNRIASQPTAAPKVYIPPSVGIGQEQSKPEILSKGLSVTYPYGAIINETDGLIILVEPSKLKQVLEKTNLVPPPGTMVATVFSEDKPSSSLTSSLIALEYEKKQGKLAYISIIAALPFSEIKGTNSGSSTSYYTLEVDLTTAWLKQVKGQVESLNANKNPSLTPTAPALTQRELAIATLISPFRVLAYP